MTESFCVFIISHGRPDKIITLKSLGRSNYTGPLFIVCDNEDKTVDRYYENFGVGKVLVFNKAEYAARVDNCDNFQNRRTTTHARNACFDFAASLGFDYFLVLDDDYTGFMHNYDRSGTFNRSVIRRIDQVFASMIRFLESDDRILSVCFIQGGDLIGGDSCPVQKTKVNDLVFLQNLPTVLVFQQAQRGRQHLHDAGKPRRHISFCP
jgi:hypothetical protein